MREILRKEILIWIGLYISIWLFCYIVLVLASFQFLPEKMNDTVVCRVNSFYSECDECIGKDVKVKKTILVRPNGKIEDLFLVHDSASYLHSPEVTKNILKNTFNINAEFMFIPVLFFLFFYFLLGIRTKKKE